eukprot:gene14653-31173_t
MNFILFFIACLLIKSSISYNIGCNSRLKRSCNIFLFNKQPNKNNANEPIIREPQNNSNFWNKVNPWISNKLGYKNETLTQSVAIPKDNSFNITKFITESISLPNLAVGIFVGFFATIQSLDLSAYEYETPAYSSVIKEQVTIFEDILNDINSFYIEKVDTNKLFEVAVTSMLKTLDPYTQFENTKDAKSFKESVSGKYGGVGLIISPIERKIQNTPLIDPIVSTSSSTII